MLSFYAKIKGNKKWIMIIPPRKKPITAINDGIWKLLSPEMACPEEQPPAYRVPKPINMPPILKIRN